jgi:hypothetical protein
MSLRANLTLLLVCAVTLPAQVAEKPLNNTDVENMIRAGLPEGSVVLAIERAVERGNTVFDVSPAGLVQLKNAGATEPVLNTMLLAPNIPPYEPSTAIPGLPVSRGLYFQSGSNWSVLDSVLLWPDIDTRWRTNWKAIWSWDRAQEDRRYVVAGRQAAVHVTGPRPTFYLRAQRPERGWMILRLTPQSDRRELTARVPDVFARQPRLTFDTGSPIELEPTASADDVLTLRPAADLTPGEYLVFKMAPGQSWLLEGYTFDIGTT